MDAPDQLIDRTEIDDAAERIAGHVRRTPLLEVEREALGTPGPVTLKLELLQHTGSFKPRGAFNAVLSAGSPPALVAASGGNHGLAVAYVAARLGLHAEIFVPASAPAIKVEGIRRLGATVTAAGEGYADALAASTAAAAASGAFAVHAYDLRATVVGQGTIGRELEEDQPDLDTVIVATGGGGLIGGIAAWWRGRARVVSVEPEGSPTLHAAFAAGEPVDVAVGGLASDALGARRLGAHGFANARAADVLPLLVPEAAIREARERLWQRLRLAVEPGAATAVAALTSGAYRPEPGERVVVVLCGANADPGDLAG